MALSKQDVEHFRTRGYSVQRQFFAPSAINEISRWLDALQAPGSQGAGEARYSEQSPTTGQGILVRVEHILGAHNPEVSRILLAPHVLAACAQLLGETPVLEEVAAFALFLCSDAAANITGAMLPIDGGWSAAS